MRAFIRHLVFFAVYVAGTAASALRAFENRLWNQSGLVGEPPLEAMMTTLSPSVVETIGVVRNWPDFAPFVVINTSGAPANSRHARVSARALKRCQRSIWAASSSTTPPRVTVVAARLVDVGDVS